MNKKSGLTLIIFGGLLLITGIQFKLMHWPQDMFYGIYSGPILLFAGLLLLLLAKRK